MVRASFLNSGQSIYLRRFFWAAALLACIGGCARSRPNGFHPPAPQAHTSVLIDKPVVDFSRGGGGLPLESTTFPGSLGELVKALELGYAKRLDVAPQRRSVTAEGDNWPWIRRLRIDVSQAVIREAYKPRQFKNGVHPEPAIATDSFEYIAQPLYYDNGATQWAIRATGARLGLLRDDKGQATLVLTDAVEGEFSFAVKQSDLRPMLLAGARQHAKGGFVVRDVRLHVASENPRSLQAELRIRAMWLLLPTSFTIRGRLDIDDQFNVHLSNLACEGDNLGGDLVAGFIDRNMKKHDRKAMPLVRWPGNRIALKDVRIHVGETVSVQAAFEGRATFAEKPTATKATP